VKRIRLLGYQGRSNRPNRQIGVLVALLSIPLLGVVCENPKTAIRVANRTGQPLLISYLDGAREVKVAGSSSLRPGGEYPFQVIEDGEDQQCTPGPVIARDIEGHEVARHESLCQTERWVIRRLDLPNND
jgi:hypothetical protein